MREGLDTPNLREVPRRPVDRRDAWREEIEFRAGLERRREHPKEWQREDDAKRDREQIEHEPPDGEAVALCPCRGAVERADGDAFHSLTPHCPLVRFALAPEGSRTRTLSPETD